MDEHTSMMGDWVPPSPTSKAFFAFFSERDEQISSFGSNQGDENSKAGASSYGNDAMLSSLPDVKRGSRGGLGDRLAARAGFNAPRLDTESIRSNDQPSIDETKSPYLTITPGISPTALLESPIFLSNSLTQASPTTGKFPLFQDGNAKCEDDFFDDVDGSSFVFKPHPEPGLPFSLDLLNKAGQVMNPHFVPNINVPARSENSFQNLIASQVQSNEGLSQSHVEGNSGSEIRGLDTISYTAEHSPPLSDQQENEGDQRVIVDPGSQGEDGYNWRKYGQKQVKGSENPRSYFKCTHADCPVKKKVEHSHEGHITEIIYNGVHTHPKPALHRRSSMGFNQLDYTQGHENDDDRASAWGATQNSLLRDWRSDSFEYTSLNSVHSELCNPSMPAIESGDAVGPSCTFSNDEDEDDCRTHGSVSESIANAVAGDESESKRSRDQRSHRSVREPRVVVQTLSDVDVLEDGYRWRKYGQKVVKGNPNPRSYYKCTSIGCTVKKLVERASHNLKSVITTYEGKHNHGVPPARNSSHANSQSQSFISSSDQSQITNLGRYERPLNLHSFNTAMMPQLQPLMNQAAPSNFSVAGLGPGMLVNPYSMPQQQRQVNDMGFTMPGSDPNVCLSSASSVYHHIMNKLPLGP